jgi:hypothetical protein
MRYILISLCILLGGCSSYYSGCARLGMDTNAVTVNCGKPSDYYFRNNKETFIYFIHSMLGGYSVEFVDGKVVSLSPL